MMLSIRNIRSVSEFCDSRLVLPFKADQCHDVGYNALKRPVKRVWREVPTRQNRPQEPRRGA